MALEPSESLRLRADHGAGENWLEIDDSAANEVLFTATNGVASLSKGQVGILARTLLDWLALHAEWPADSARLVRLAQFVGDQVGADPNEYPSMNDPERSGVGLVSEFLHDDGAD